MVLGFKAGGLLCVLRFGWFLGQRVCYVWVSGYGLDACGGDCECLGRFGFCDFGLGRGWCNITVCVV